MSYCKIDLSSINAGLSHQRSNLRTIIRYCFVNNLKLIKPIFKLHGKHNDNNELTSDLSEYYDLDGITVDGKPFKLHDDDNYSYTINKREYSHGGSLRFVEPFKNLLHINVVIPYRKDIIDIANKVSSELDEYICIHVRRGDRITNKQIDIDTQPDNIIKKINEYKVKNVYIMTNRLNELKSLSSFKNIHFYTDYKFLEDIKDNYYLYCVENVIMELAKIRCSTFNVKLNSFVDTFQPIYHCYLTNHIGWQ